MPLSVIRELGDRVAGLLVPRGALAEAVEEIVHDVAPASRFGAGDLIDALAAAGELPQQLDPDSRFGDPAVTLYRGRDFVIDAYFWLDPRTGIHNHSFSGVFCLLDGQSLNCDYCFDSDDSDSADVRTGELVLQNLTVMNPGDTFRIVGGADAIHQVWHLAKPTVSLVIRSVQDNDRMEIFQYLPPGLSARDAAHLPPAAAKRLQMMEFLNSTDRNSLDAFTKETLSTAGDLAGLWTCWKYHRLTGEDATRWVTTGWSTALQDAQFSDAAGHFTFSELEDTGDRMLLACLVTGCAREQVLPLFASVEDVIARLKTLAEMQAVDFRFNETGWDIAGRILRGEGREEIVAGLQDAYDTEDSCADDVSAFLASVERHPLLRGFLRENATTS
jgi:predicted metal-dependent enzyme (double-stranded beta helix superfamily)